MPSTTSDSASARRPNILLITTDQQRGDCLGINGNAYIETPNLDHLASQGVNFTRGYTTCPVCVPARRTLLSGQSPDTHGLRKYQDGLEFNPPATLPGELSAAGYQTQLIGKMHLHPQGKRYGFDNIVLSETTHYRPQSEFQKRNDYVSWLAAQGVTRHPHTHGINGNGRITRPWGMEEHLHINNWMAEEAVRFLTERRDPTCPVFLHLSFFHPHPPLVPLDHYFQRYLSKDLPGPTHGMWSRGEPELHRPVIPPDSATGPYDPEIIRRATAAYYALINHIDDCIAYILERWRGYGSPDGNEPLYILFSSDHGEMMGDHQLFRKSLGYEASARVPFFLTGLGTPPVPNEARSSQELVCWEDVAPTLLDLAGVAIPPSMEGISLAPLLRGEAPAQRRDHIFGQCGGHHHNLWVTTATHKYLWFPRTNEEQLFNLAVDPKECHDISGDDAGTLDKMRNLLATHVATRKDLTYKREDLKPCRNQEPHIFWPQPTAA
ncbi:arylsulfatase [Verrucomicrobia bacterium LW23]|nr:arylsulfatase [Verrucomicrobia bacterium LW23]